LDPLLLAVNKSPIRYIAGIAVAQVFYLVAMITLVVTQPSYSSGFAILATTSILGIAASYFIHRPLFDGTEKFAYPKISMVLLLGTAALLALIALMLVAPFRHEPEKMQRPLWLMAMIVCASMAFSLSATLAPLVVYWKSRRGLPGSTSDK